MRLCPIIIIIVLLITSNYLFSQKEFYNWYFGENAGLTFLPDGNIPLELMGSAMSTLEGVATISDSKGSLLFYTDGVSLYNKNHSVMKNGSDLAGGSSSAQSCIIVPKPLDEHKYYIFTVDQIPTLSGLSYSIIDMKQDGGLGEVVEKNIKLVDQTSEKITAVKVNGKSAYWIVTHSSNSNSYYSFYLDVVGINDTPVITQIGNNFAGDEWKNSGCMKVSNKGDVLAMSVRGDNLNNSSVEIFLFDNETGRLSNPVVFPTSTLSYGVEFSKDDKYIYISCGTSNKNSILYQLDISSYEPSQIVLSAQVIATTSTEWWGSLQMAPNGKIYLAKYKENNLGVVNNPENQGLNCGFVLDGFKMTLGRSTLGLPNSLPLFQCSFQSVSITGKNEICQSEEAVLTVDGEYESYEWSTGAEGQSITVTSPGTYTVEVKDEEGCSGFASFTVEEKPPFTADIDATADMICESEEAILTLEEDYESYEWSTGADSKSIIVTSPGTYTVEVVDENGCIGFASFTVEEKPPFTASIEGDAQLCDEQGAVLTLTEDYESYDWSNGADSKSITVTKAGTYTVEVVDENGCIGFASFTVEESSVNADIAIAYGGCQGREYALMTASPGGDGYEYEWSHGAEARTVKVTEEGIYSVEVTDPLGCKGTESVNVKFKGGTGGKGEEIGFEIKNYTSDYAVKEHRIPVHASIDPDLLPYDMTGCEMILRFDPRYLIPMKSSKGAFTYPYDNNDSLLSVKIDKFRFRKQEEKFFELITHLVYDIDNPSSYLDIEAVIWENECMETYIISDGILTLDGCLDHISQLLLVLTQKVTAVYPNPADDEINIQMLAELKEDIKADILNSTGKVVKKVTLQSGEDLHTISLQGLAAGAYTVRIYWKDKTDKFKFVKQ